MAPIRGLSWSASTSVLGALLDIVKIAVLAHYLAPESFAAFAIALIVVGFSQIFSEGGIGNAVVSIADIDRVQAASIFNVSILIAVAISLVVAAVSPWIASFYAQPVLQDVIPLIALTIPLSSASRLLQAFLQREMDMRSIAMANIAAKVAGVGSAWWLAVNHYDIYALVWSSLVTYIVLFLMTFIIGRDLMDWSPTIHWRKIRNVLSFSGFQLVEFLLSFFARNFDVLLLTKLLGAEVTGIYVVCKNLLMQGGEVIVSTFVRYFHPLMATVQANSRQLNETYLNFYRSVTFCICLAYGVIALNSSLISDLMLSERFVGADGLMQILALLFILRFCTRPVATLWLVKQKPQIGVIWNVLIAGFVPAVIMLFYPLGMESVVHSLILLQALLLSGTIGLTYYLNNRNKNQIKRQVSWLLLCGLSLCFTAVVVDVFNPDTLVKASLSVIMACILVMLAWRKRSLFLGAANT